MTQKCIVRSSDNVVINSVKLPDDWTGGDGEWQAPAGHYLADGAGAAGDTYDPNNQTYTKPAMPAPTVAQVQAECDRRLAGGFDYDFTDGRGVHTIGTTEKDMKGWREVTDMANALVALGDTSTTITISTDTGVAAVTALEWQAILLAAAAFRQPIWAYSFALQAQDPIPANYTDDEHWTSA